jgi:hypothetical protein
MTLANFIEERASPKARKANSLLKTALENGGIGNGDETGFGLACQLRDNGVIAKEALATLENYARDVMQDTVKPFSESDAKRWWDSANSQPARTPSLSEPDEILLEPPQSVNSPELAPEALYGLPGRIVRLLEPQTEADPAALLLTLLTVFGVIFGNRAFYRVGGASHYPNLFVVIVGLSSKSRKGTSWSEAKRVVELAFPRFQEDFVKSGLSSGEGLIAAVSDTSTDKREESKREPKPGEYRLNFTKNDQVLILETEFAQALTVLARQGNTLGPVLRNAYDSATLGTLTKNAPLKAIGTHIGLLGHITMDELQKKLSDTDAHNGVGNRILWGFAKRSKNLPFPGPLGEKQLAEVAEAFKEAVRNPALRGEMQLSTKARDLWVKEYDRLSEDQYGLVGSLTSRAEAQVLRLAMIYALLDESMTIKSQHLRAALSVWRYCEESVQHIFSSRSGDPVQKRVLDLLKATGKDGMKRSELSQSLGGHVRSNNLEQILKRLEELGAMERVVIRPPPGSKGGRPHEILRLIKSSK